MMASDPDEWPPSPLEETERKGVCASAKCYPARVLQVAGLYQKLHVDNTAAGNPVSDVHRHMKNVRIIFWLLPTWVSGRWEC